MSRVEGSASSTSDALGTQNGHDHVFTALRPTYRLEGRSREERARAHAANLANRRLDVRDLERFVEGIVERARQATTLDAFIANGRPVMEAWEARIWEPDANPAERADMMEVVADFRRVLRNGSGALEALRAKLEHRRVPGDARLTASAALKLRVAGREVGVEAALHDRAISGGGRVAGVEVASHVEPGRARDRIDVGVGPVAVSLDGDRIEGVELRAPGGYAKLENGAVEVGIAAGRRFGPKDGPNVVAEVKLGVSVQTLDAETVRRALSPEDQWAVRRR